MASSMHGTPSTLRQSAARELEMNDIPDSAYEPGPGHYFGPESSCYSSLGKQGITKCRSAPAIKLAKTNWDDWSKVLISKNHCKTMLGRESPGVTYETPHAGLPCTAKIGTSKRPPLSQADPHGSPGPIYDTRGDCGEPVGAAGPPGARAGKGFGLASRFRAERGGGVGPGEYPRKDTAVALGGGRSIGASREAYDKVCTPGWEVEGRCRLSPGPGPPLWTDLKLKNGGGGGFSKAQRFSSQGADPGPGPGSYRRDERDVSNSKQHLSDTATPSVGRFGRCPTKPRFRAQLAMLTARHGAWGYF